MQELNRLDKGITEGSRASTKRHIAWLDDQIATAWKRSIKAALQTSPELSRRAALLPECSGRGHTHFACYPGGGFAGTGRTCDGKQLTSLDLGLAPWFP